MIFPLSPTKPDSSLAGTSAIGVWWYDDAPDRQLLISFREDPAKAKATLPKRLPGSKFSDLHVEPLHPHAELWPRVVALFPEYAELRFTGRLRDAKPGDMEFVLSEESQKAQAFLCLPRGRVNLVARPDGSERFELLLPPEMANDLRLVNQVCRDYSLPPWQVTICPDGHYSLVEMGR